MGTFRITVEIADPLGQHFEAVEMLVDTGATFTKAPRDLLPWGYPVRSRQTVWSIAQPSSYPVSW